MLRNLAWRAAGQMGQYLQSSEDDISVYAYSLEILLISICEIAGYLAIAAFVITSYSIHYTKLYDIVPAPAVAGARKRVSRRRSWRVFSCSGPCIAAWIRDMSEL